MLCKIVFLTNPRDLMPVDIDLERMEHDTYKKLRPEFL